MAAQLLVRPVKIHIYILFHSPSQLQCPFFIEASDSSQNHQWTKMLRRCPPGTSKKNFFYHPLSITTSIPPFDILLEHPLVVSWLGEKSLAQLVAHWLFYHSFVSHETQPSNPSATSYGSSRARSSHSNNHYVGFLAQVWSPQLR